MTTLAVVAHTGKSLGDGLASLRSALADAGHADALWYKVSKSKQAPPQVRKALKSNADRVLVWGGDGTVRRCIDTIVEEGSNAELAILPAGTANLLATGLGVPIDLQGALEVALKGYVRRIDLGVMNGERFAVMAGTGFDAMMIRDADDKNRAGRLAYVLAGMKHLVEPNTKVVVEVDGQPWFKGRAACVLIGNMGRVIGGLTLFPDARPDDGLLDIGVVTAEHRLDWLRVGLRAAAGRIDSSPMVQMTQGSRMTVRLAERQPWEMDGGDRPDTKRLKVCVLPARLPICVPAP